MELRKEIDATRHSEGTAPKESFEVILSQNIEFQWHHDRLNAWIAGHRYGVAI